MTTWMKAALFVLLAVPATMVVTACRVCAE